VWLEPQTGSYESDRRTLAKSCPTQSLSSIEEYDIELKAFPAAEIIMLKHCDHALLLHADADFAAAAGAADAGDLKAVILSHTPR